MSTPNRSNLHQPGTTYHVLIWCDLSPAGVSPRERSHSLRCTSVRLYPMVLSPSECLLGHRRQLTDEEDALSCACELWPGRRRITLWLARGWTDLVSAGIADAIDAGRVTWRWITLDGPLCLLDGRYQDRPLRITSLAAWCGRRWDSWGDSVRRDAALWPYVCSLVSGTEQERVAVASVLTCLGGLQLLDAPRVPLTVAGLARIWWRRYLGSAQIVSQATGSSAAAPTAQSGGALTLPVGGRSRSVEAAERHCCYGLPRMQMMRGRVEGPITVLDQRSAYLAALMTTPLALRFVGSTHDVEGRHVGRHLRSSVCTALVRIRSTTMPHPLRVHGRVRWAPGQYWTWLCGDDLLRAVQARQVERCHVIHRYQPLVPRRNALAEVYQQLTLLELSGASAYRQLLRALYCALIGQWGRWGREWTDIDWPSPVGRWGTWSMGHPQTDEITRWRCVGGRTQYRRDTGTPRDASPLSYALVLAGVRAALADLADAVTSTNVLAMSADALWILPAAADVLREISSRQHGRRVEIHHETVYDRVWLDGHGRAVVEQRGQRWPVLLGVPTHAEVGPDGVSRWFISSADAPGTSKRGRALVRRTALTWDVGRFVEQHSYAAEPVMLPPVIHAPAMREELLLRPIRHSEAPTSTEGEES